jgi:hypothetical protein
VDSKAAADADALVRKFMWDHWNQRKRGLVVATYFSIEGQPKTNSVYIEPWTDGRWEIVVESRFRADPRASGDERAKMETHCASYDSVEREQSPGGTSPEQALDDPHLYVLRLLNSYDAECDIRHQVEDYDQYLEDRYATQIQRIKLFGSHPKPTAP